tara:strand:- start:129 stop:398 length:270 start_codon:yes stop_codon:yes gene_type:complete
MEYLADGDVKVSHCKGYEYGNQQNDCKARHNKSGILEAYAVVFVHLTLFCPYPGALQCLPLDARSQKLRCVSRETGRFVAWEDPTAVVP